MNILHEMGRVFQLEIATLRSVRDGLNEDYAKAAELMFSCQGKVVICGAGKSGLIAQKIAATMVSTGTLATFLHPNDALHGDAGVVRAADVVLAISKSGETEELLGLLPFLKQCNVPVILITANSQSSLAKGSKIVLYTPVEEEACPLNLAPTSSTTAALVVGDALAMTLMKMRRFEPEHFAALHPGGQLGKRLLMTVSDIMRSGEDNPVLEVTDSVHEMLYEISSKRCGAVSIINGAGNLIGLVTDHDIRSVLEQGKDLFALRISDIMNDKPTHTHSSAKAVEALDLMENRENPFLVLPVLEPSENKVVGMIHLHDLIAKGL